MTLNLKRRNAQAVLTLFAAALGLLIAGCGSSAKSPASGTTPSGSAPGPSTATGTPYVVGTINDDPTQSEPDVFATLQAEASEINAGGGINGHPIKVIHCSGQLNQKRHRVLRSGVRVEFLGSGDGRQLRGKRCRSDTDPRLRGARSVRQFRDAAC
jgi:hypothetical protein